MELLSELMRSERELTQRGGDVYQERLTDDALVVVPGQVMVKAETAAAIDASPRWDRTDFADERLVQITQEVAAVSYRFSGQRGDGPVYRALLSSVYVKRNGTWCLALHQQTPLDEQERRREGSSRAVT